jgi:hypothetical protein
MGKRVVWTDQARADIRGIEQAIAIQVHKTLGRYVLSGEGATKQLKGITPALIRLGAQNHRISSASTATPLKSNAFSTARKRTAEPHENVERLLSPSRFICGRAWCLLGKENPNASGRVILT